MRRKELEKKGYGVRSMVDTRKDRGRWMGR